MIVLHCLSQNQLNFHDKKREKRKKEEREERAEKEAKEIMFSVHIFDHFKSFDHQAFDLLIFFLQRGLKLLSTL